MILLSNCHGSNKIDVIDFQLLICDLDFEYTSIYKAYNSDVKVCTTSNLWVVLVLRTPQHVYERTQINLATRFVV